MPHTNGNNHKRLVAQGYRFLGNFDSSDLGKTLSEFLESYNGLVTGAAYVSPESHDVLSGKVAIFGRNTPMLGKRYPIS